MGQLLLGFRSLLVKIAIFIVMAALLAWALGGTLWPRAVVVEYEPVRVGDAAWFWSLSVGGERRRGDRSATQPRWTMVVRNGEGQEGAPFPSADEPATFQRVTEPIRFNHRIAFAGQLASAPAWATWDSPQDGQWVLFIAQDQAIYSAHHMPDRLAVEQQLVRLAAGLDVQTAAEIRAQRLRVIDPAHDLAADGG